MNITDAKYINNPFSNQKEGIKVTIDSEIMSVPFDSDNRHYIAILEWVAAGNKIEEAD